MSKETDIRDFLSEIKHELNEAINKCLERMNINLKTDELEQNIGLEHEYYKLLNQFIDHLKDIKKANEEAK